MVIETTHLNTLIAVANTGSFSKAADELGITQSAVSQNLKRLEQRIGVPLVIKTAKSTALTAEGEKLVELSRTFFTQTETFLAEVSNSQNEMSGQLRIGTLMGLGTTWVAPKMIEFSKIYPSMHLKVTMGFPEDLVAQFEAQKLDALILTKSSVPAFVDAIPLDTEKTTLVVPKSYGIQNTEKITLKEVLSFPLIFFQDKDPLFFDWCKAHFGTLPKGGVHPRLTMNSFSHILQAVAQGLGIAVIPTHVIEHYKYLHQEITTLGKSFEVENTTLYFVMQQGGATHQRLKTLLDYFQLPEIKK